MALQRWRREMNEMQTDRWTGTTIFLIINGFPEAEFIILGPPDTPYHNGCFAVYAKFPLDYPHKPPKIRLLTPIYHCNISQDGIVCMDILGD
jgi:ubiquitin-protein ligase